MEKLRKPLIIGVIICTVLTCLTGIFIKDETLSLCLEFEIITTLFWTFLVFLPLAWIKNTDTKSLFLKMFIGRIVILLICDLFITPYIFILDFISLFICFIIAAFSFTSKFYKKYVLRDSKFTISTCPHCHKEIKEGDKCCKFCGEKIPDSKEQ